MKRLFSDMQAKQSDALTKQADQPLHLYVLANSSCSACIQHVAAYPTNSEAFHRWLAQAVRGHHKAGLDHEQFCGSLKDARLQLYPPFPTCYSHVNPIPSHDTCKVGEGRHRLCCEQAREEGKKGQGCQEGQEVEERQG